MTVTFTNKGSLLNGMCLGAIHNWAKDGTKVIIEKIIILGPDKKAAEAEKITLTVTK